MAPGREPNCAISAGVRMAARHGGGAPVVLVHGSASDLRTWEAQVPAIGAAYRAIAYSRRYAPPNGDIGANVDDPLLPHVEGLIAFLPALEISAAHLVGHSWGGFIALLAAIRNPGIVRSLVLLEPPVLSLFVGTPPRARGLLPLLFRRPRTALAIVRFGAGAAPGGRRSNAATTRRRCGPSARACSESCTSRGSRRSACGRCATTSGRFARNFSERGSRRSTTTTCAACGRRSCCSTGSTAPPCCAVSGDRLEELLPDVQRVRVPGATHLMHEDESRPVNRAILDFLGRQPPRTSP